jgi:hypothetical protein
MKYCLWGCLTSVTYSLYFVINCSQNDDGNDSYNNDDDHYTVQVTLFIFMMGWDCLCGTVAISGPIVHPADDTWVNMERRCNDIDRENQMTWRETTLSNTNSVVTKSDKIFLCISTVSSEEKFKVSDPLHASVIREWRLGNHCWSVCTDAFQKFQVSLWCCIRIDGLEFCQLTVWAV